MPDERTYGEEEVAEIFKAAAAARQEAGSTALAPAAGFTLAELQSIGGEVGLAPERVAQAAAAVDLRRGAVRRTDLGMPVSVGRTVDLPRAPTELEWEMLVGDLRETFGARGRVGSRGDVREWTNGNLHAYVEPTATGYRLRLGTTRGSAMAGNRMGAAGLVMALITLVVLAMTGALPEAILGPMLIALMGGGSLAWNAVSLPGWAQRREAQMEAVAVRARTLLGAPPAPRLPPAGVPLLPIAGDARWPAAGNPQLTAG
ncbi:MAG TPA: hypothetical protein VGC13_09685 [Longimicrobium sp.]|jgi:hypothetical protein|uniref:hypothetical protein n=1 Tax=Longimicrobium sp. TaxID=2029185 RepID=UPI002ED9B904